MASRTNNHPQPGVTANKSRIEQIVSLRAIEAGLSNDTGASLWKFASTDAGFDPDVVLVGIGTELMFEVLAAAGYLRALAPSLAVRVVHVSDATVLTLERSDCPSLSPEDFDELFTSHRHIHFNYDGQADKLQHLLSGPPCLERMSISSYDQTETGVTPFDAMIRNHCSRYHISYIAANAGAKCNHEMNLHLGFVSATIQYDLARVQEYIRKRGEDT